MVAPGVYESLTSLYSIIVYHVETCHPNGIKSAEVTPVPKGKHRDKVDNYRPVSVLPAVVKVMESSRLVHGQLYIIT